MSNVIVSASGFLLTYDLCYIARDQGTRTSLSQTYPYISSYMSRESYRPRRAKIPYPKTHAPLFAMQAPSTQSLCYIHTISYTHPSHHLYQSHLPSPHPVLHRSSQLEQSNPSFPNFSFTALCASQSHIPNSLLLPTRGPLFFIHSWKSLAHQ